MRGNAAGTVASHILTIGLAVSDILVAQVVLFGLV